MCHSTSNATDTSYCSTILPTHHEDESAKRMESRMSELDDYHFAEVARITGTLGAIREKYVRADSFTEDKDA